MPPKAANASSSIPSGTILNNGLPLITSAASLSPLKAPFFFIFGCLPPTNCLLICLVFLLVFSVHSLALLWSLLPPLFSCDCGLPFWKSLLPLVFSNLFYCLPFLLGLDWDLSFLFCNILSTFANYFLFWALLCLPLPLGFWSCLPLPFWPLPIF